MAATAPPTYSPYPPQQPYPAPDGKENLSYTATTTTQVQYNQNQPPPSYNQAQPPPAGFNPQYPPQQMGYPPQQQMGYPPQAYPPPQPMQTYAPPPVINNNNNNNNTVVIGQQPSVVVVQQQGGCPSCHMGNLHGGIPCWAIAMIILMILIFWPLAFVFCCVHERRCSRCGYTQTDCC